MSLTHREEKILEAVIDGSSVPFDPVTRREKIFAKAAGEDIELAPPITKEEQILSALAAKGSGGGGSSDFSTAEVTVIGAGTANCATLITGPDNKQYTAHAASSGTNTVILTEAGALLYVDTSTFSVGQLSGNIETVGASGRQYLVTGNCSIEIAPK